MIKKEKIVTLEAFRQLQVINDIGVDISGFDHPFCDNDHLALSWIQAPSVDVGQCHIDAISLIQSNFGTPSNLEVVTRMGNQLVHFWPRRDKVSIV